jgi:hypothetical protein
MGRVAIAVALMAACGAGAAGCGGDAPGSAARAHTTRTLVSPGGVRPIAAPQPGRATPPLPAWHGPAPHAGGDVATGPYGRAWLSTTRDSDGDRVVTLWLRRQGGARRMLAASGGVMEGGSDPVSPVWVGASLIWSSSRDDDGTSYDSTVIRWDSRTGRRTQASVGDAYIEWLARSGRDLAVRYVPSDESGDGIGPDPARARTGSLPLRALGL